MPVKLTEVIVKQWFFERGSELISSYISSCSPVLFKCSKCGEIQEYNKFYALKQKNPNCLCKSCSKKFGIEKHIKYTEEKVRELLKTNFGAELVKYTGPSTELFFVCKTCGKQVRASCMSDLLNRKSDFKGLCRTCMLKEYANESAGDKKKEIQEYLKSKGSELLSEYLRSSDPIVFKCSKCGKKARNFKFNHLKSRNPDCMCFKCNLFLTRPPEKSIQSNSVFIPRTREKFEEFLNKYGSKLVHYTRSIENKIYTCIRCNSEISTTVPIATLIQQKRVYCQKCLFAVKPRLYKGLIEPKRGIDIVREYLESQGSKLLEPFTNQSSTFNFTCSKCGKPAKYYGLLNLRQVNPKCQCVKCNLQNRRKEDVLFEDNNTDRYSNSFYKDWVKKVFLMANYKCSVLGTKVKLIPHHLFGWASHKELRPYFWNGVVIEESIHKKFHKMFGYGQNTFLQFKDFIEHGSYIDSLEEFSEIKPSKVYLFSNENMVFDIFQMLENFLDTKLDFSDRGLNYISYYPNEILNKHRIVNSQIVTKSFLEDGIIKIGARKLVLSEISKKEAESFFEENHLKGFISANLYYGLSDPKSGSLLMGMSFSDKPKDTSFNWELVQFCSKVNYIISGGVSKLFNSFVKKYPKVSIISYCDIRTSSLNPDQTVYPLLGFEFSHDLPMKIVSVKDCENFYFGAHVFVFNQK